MAKRRPVKKLGQANGPPRDVDAYLAAIPADMRASLERLRKLIQRAAPAAVEGISYQIPIFNLHGGLVGFGAGKSHCSFYVMSPAVMAAHAAQLENYSIGKGSIRFPADEPLPAALVTKLVKARIAENATRAGK